MAIANDAIPTSTMKMGVWASPSTPQTSGPRKIAPSTTTRQTPVRQPSLATSVCSRITPSGSIHPAIPRPKSAQPSTISGSEPSPTVKSPMPSTAATPTSTGGRPTRSASQPTGSNTARSRIWASDSSPQIPARSSTNSRVPRSGMTNWLTADQASAMITPSANIRRTIGGTAASCECIEGSAFVTRTAGRSGAERRREITGKGERRAQRQHHRRGGHQQGDIPAPALGQQADEDQAAEHAQHPGELKGVEPHRGPTPLRILEDGGEAAPHDQRVREPGEQPAQHQHRQRSRGGQQQHAGEQRDRREGERGGEPARGERTHRPVGGHAREAKRAGEEAELPVGQSLGPGDLGQQRAEGADADRGGENDEDQQRRAGERTCGHRRGRLRGRT